MVCSKMLGKLTNKNALQVTGDWADPGFFKSGSSFLGVVESRGYVHKMLRSENYNLIENAFTPEILAMLRSRNCNEIAV